MSKYLLALTAMLMAFPSYADFTGNVGAASKHTFRGETQSGQDLALSAGADYQGPLGIYAGAWGYTGSIEDFDTSEVNAYGGLAFNLWDLSIGLGAIRYERSQQTAVSEYNLNLAWSDYRLSTYQDEGAEYQYHEVAANYDFWGNSGIALTLGLMQQDIIDEEAFNFSISWVLAMPGEVDVDLTFARHQDDGNSVSLGMSQQFDW